MKVKKNKRDWFGRSNESSCDKDKEGDFKNWYNWEGNSVVSFYR